MLARESATKLGVKVRLVSVLLKEMTEIAGEIHLG